MHDPEAVLEALIEADVEGIVIVDSEARVVYLNRAYEEILGLNRDDAIGKHVTKVIDNTRLHEVVQTGVPQISQVQRIRGLNAVVQRIPLMKDGKPFAAVGKVVFKNKGEVESLIKKLELMEKKVKYYENELSSILGAKYDFDDIITNSLRMIELKKLAKRVAHSNATVLIRGESGVGKELFAHAVHKASPRSSFPFVRVNCAAVPENLIEAELFGYEEGAFTGAKKYGKPGKLELADGGTLFLDEIGDMPLAMQAKILRCIQEREFERVGGLKPIKVDIRIIAATNCNLEEMVAKELFREDLYYRINVVSLVIPPLRERKEDIPLLTSYFLKKLYAEDGYKPKKMEKETMEILQSYNWPGNIRELRNVIEKMLNFAESDFLTPHDIPQNIIKGQGKKRRYNQPLKSLMDETEKDLLVHALQLTKGNKTRAAELLGIHRSTLYDKLEKHHIE